MNTAIKVFGTYSFFAICLIAFLGVGVAFSAIELDREISCSFDPALGQRNPFGGRAYIVVTEKDGDTQFLFEQFPVPVLDKRGQGRSITIESARTLIFYDTDIETARGLVRRNLEYYYALIGYEDIAGFSSYDEAMSCD